MTLDELKERQSWPLRQKIDHALYTIETFITRTEGKCYVAFSGGKDSTVLLDLVRIIDKSVPAIFVNTGNEWPEVLSFVRGLKEKDPNIIELHPSMTPREVWAKYGFPLASKAQAEYVHRLRTSPETAQKYILRSASKGWSFGQVAKRWEYLINEPYATSHLCCKALKKDPAHKYAKETGRYPILGTMASESDLRRTEYIRRGGCNTFSSTRGVGIRSTPLAIWTDEDIWDYIKMRNLDIAEIYYKGAARTGCVGCGFGAHICSERFKILFDLYPKYYEMIMGYTNNGVTYREALRKALRVGEQELPEESTELPFPKD